MKKFFRIIVLWFVALVLCGCGTTTNVDRVTEEDLNQESSIIFIRPKRFVLAFGSLSAVEYVEITYERSYRNDAGQLVVETGIRNRGPVSWTNWFCRAPEILQLRVQTHFYEGARSRSNELYQTNGSTISIGRGETYVYKVVCPVANAVDYQIVLGD
ncbi:MAG: hypothetical protein MJ033_05770 [Victivallaceae bacterium]|nr:hypothetical protein [Victivallaceae bacterium]